ncbi:MAG: NADH:flavin oxidoreductase [Candidatus Helarchaeota archaeon]|nr:NADH:flavin oxidoreductase [Candidatus Helarchaeota archaeon]
MVKVELKKLFSPRRIGNIQIKNRIVRSGTFEGMASREGYVTDQLIKLYADLAQGGTGLIITGAAAVDSRYTVGSRCACFNDDSIISGQKKLVEAVHEYPSVKIGAQLAHNGRAGSHPKYKSVAPSPILYKPTKQVPKELTVEEIRILTKKFVAAGRRAYESEYDLVQLHACHGYLLSSFLSPYTNRRTDEYGGSLGNRTRMFVDIYNQLRDEVGKNFPIIVKMQVVDGLPEGLILEEAKKIAEILVNTGYDAIEPSGGSSELRMETSNTLPSKKVKTPEDENYLLPAAKELHPIMKNCALIQVGGIRNPLSAEKMLQENLCDFISMCRPLIHEPDLPNRWYKGDHSPARCISCNSCLNAIFIGQPVYCEVKEKLEKKKKV